MPTITDWMTSITTIILAIITAYYAITNHRMMSFQRKIFEFENRPFLAFDCITMHLYKKNESEDNKVGIQFGLRLKNVGKVIIQYKVNKIICSIDNKTLHHPNLVNSGGFIYPTQTTDYSYDTFWDTDISEPVITGMLEYQIEYTGNEDVKYLTERKISIQYFTISQSIQWKSIEENEIKCIE